MAPNVYIYVICESSLYRSSNICYIYPLLPRNSGIQPREYAYLTHLMPICSIMLYLNQLYAYMITPAIFGDSTRLFQIWFYDYLGTAIPRLYDLAAALSSVF